MEQPATALAPAPGWSIVDANTGELKSRNAELRRKGVASLALAICLSLAVSLVVADWGFSMGAPFAVLLFVGLAVAFIRRLQSTLSGPLSASVLTANWMARQGLLDAEGRLTPLGVSIAEKLAGAAAESTDPRTTQEVAVAAYVEASRLHRSNEPWLQPMARVVEDLDLSAFEASLSQRA
jgi:hypothetical protein